MIELTKEDVESTYKHKLYIKNVLNYKLKDLLDNYFSDTGISKRIHAFLFMKAKNKFNTNSDNLLTVGKKGGIWNTKSPNSYIKLGKLLSNLLIVNTISNKYYKLEDKEIEQLVTTWKSWYSVDISKVKTTKDISWVYNKAHGSSGDLSCSCMRGFGEYMKIYEDLDCSIAYVEDEKQLLARALIWRVLDENDRELRVHDRIFSSKEIDKITLTKYFEDNNIKHIKDIDSALRTVLTIEDKFYGDGVPYVDNMYCLSSDYRLSTNDDYNGQLQSTSGSYDYYTGDKITNSSCFCEHCEEYVDYHEDDMVYVEGVGNVCPCCIDEDYVFCEDVDGYVSTDSAVYLDSEDTYVSENYSYLLYCEAEDINIDSTTTDYIQIGYDYYTLEYEESNLYFAEDTETYHLDAYDLYWVEDEMYYVENCDDLWVTEDGVYYNSFECIPIDEQEKAERC